jgi:hypothetical protein
MTLGRMKENVMRANSLHVVPAQAGTHTLRASDAEGVSRSGKHRAKQ